MDGLIVEGSVYFSVSVCFCVYVCEREDLGRWQPLSQAYRQTLSPPPALNRSSLWHAQKCHELALSVYCVCVCVCVCVLGVSVYVCLCSTSSSSVRVCLYCACTTRAVADENCVKYTTAALRLLFFFSFFFFYHCSLTQAATHTNK